MRHLFRIAVPGVSALAAGLLYTSNAWSAPGTNGFRVLHHESVQISSAKGVGSAERMSFTAYGRHFDLNVAPNERIRRGLPTSAAVPLAGSVEGLAGSWVRVTRSASGLRGILFDGQDLYAIEPAAEAAAVTVQPLSASDGDTVVYRLSDALMPVQTMSCEVAKADSTPETPATAADAFQQLSTELQTFQIAEAETAEANATRQVRIGVVADYEFVTQFGNSTPEDAIVARMNIVDGIFSTQLGVKVSLGTPTLFRSASDPFTKSKASELLAELATYRFGSQAQQQYGITHLMTGRDLETTTVGIAYLSELCDEKNGVSLSQSGLNTTQAALIAAHEIGHNFGAPHDGESACASSPQTFLMAPQLNGSDKFSACSISQIQALMNNMSSACLKDYVPPDASITGPSAPVNAVVGTAMVASFSVTSAGDDASSNVNVSVTVPAELTVNSASVNGGTCQTGTVGSVTCALGTLASGDTRQVDLNLTPTVTGSLALNASVSSSNDANSSNNSGTVSVNATTSSAPPATPPVTGGSSTAGDGGGGGGGSMDFSLLSLLGIASLAAISRRRLRLPAR